MKCTACHKGDLRPMFLEPDFRAHECDHCQGHWVLITDYVSWLALQPTTADLLEIPFELSETKQALVCPVSGTLMQKFRYATNGEHRLDYSAAVAGVWLDQGEWLFLKQQGLSGSLNKIFTDQWQRQLRETHAAQTFAALYSQKFGEDYEKVKSLRAWIEQHPAKGDIRAYLMAEDPYSSQR